MVKASQIVVRAAVRSGLHGQFIPFFGVERKGSPVYGYLRLSREEIRRKTQIYEPDMLVIMDDTLVSMPNTYAGLKPGGIVLINSAKPLDELLVPDCAGLVAAVDATEISERRFGKNLPNTSVLGAFARIVDLVAHAPHFDAIASASGDANRLAAEEGYASGRILKGEAAK